MRRFSLRAAIVSVATAAACALGMTPATAQAIPSLPALPATSSLVSAPHLNNPDCVPTSDVKEPVILLHGTLNDASVWNGAIDVLGRAGMCAWAIDYGAMDNSLVRNFPGVKGIADINASSVEVARKIDHIRAVTGSQKVNLVGHSQGGLQAKLYVEKHGSPDNVARVVGLGVNLHGTTMNGMLPVIDFLRTHMYEPARFIASTVSLQQVSGSRLLAETDRLPDTSAGVLYTSIYSPADTVVTPNSSSMMRATDGADVVNLNLAKVCGTSPKHEFLPKNTTAVSQMLWALQRKPGETPNPSTCGRVQGVDLGLPSNI